MKANWKLLGALIAALFVSVAAFAAETTPAPAATPAGTWKWTSPGRGGGPGFEQALKLELTDGKLSGTVLGRKGPMGDIPDAAITDASYSEGEVKFSVTRSFNDRTFTVTYQGKLEGDTIKGSLTRPGRDGEVRKSEWVATRAK